jgi:DNA adenine methylase
MTGMTAIAETTRPICRYHGGKWLLAPWILGFFPEHSTYVEPFAGVASVLLRKPRVKCEVVNDLNEDVVNLFKVLRTPLLAAEFRQLVALTPYSRAELEECWDMGSRAGMLERARRFVVRATMSHGSKGSIQLVRGGFRSKRAGEVSPAVDWAGYPDAIPALTDRLRGVVVERRDALEVLGIYDGPETLHYVDPPYVQSTRVLHQGTYPHELTDEGHEALAERLHGLKGGVVLSGYPCELYERLYAGWRRVERRAYADVASARTECLWLNGWVQERLLLPLLSWG